MSKINTWGQTLKVVLKQNAFLSLTKCHSWLWRSQRPLAVNKRSNVALKVKLQQFHTCPFWSSCKYKDEWDPLVAALCLAPEVAASRAEQSLISQTLISLIKHLEIIVTVWWFGRKCPPPKWSGTIWRYGFIGIGMALLEEVCRCGGGLWGVFCSSYSQGHTVFPVAFCQDVVSTMPACTTQKLVPGTRVLLLKAWPCFCLEEFVLWYFKL